MTGAKAKVQVLYFYTCSRCLSQAASHDESPTYCWHGEDVPMEFDKLVWRAVDDRN